MYKSGEKSLIYREGKSDSKKWEGENDNMKILHVIIMMTMKMNDDDGDDDDA